MSTFPRLQVHHDPPTSFATPNASSLVPAVSSTPLRRLTRHGSAISAIPATRRRCLPPELTILMSHAATQGAAGNAWDRLETPSNVYLELAAQSSRTSLPTSARMGAADAVWADKISHGTIHQPALTCNCATRCVRPREVLRTGYGVTPRARFYT